MTNAPIERMTPAGRRDAMRKLLESTFGERDVERLWQQLEPLIRNRIGHGEPLTPKMPGDADDPKDNYWKGVWQVYHAE